jgi:hypothetical protein
MTDMEGLTIPPQMRNELTFMANHPGVAGLHLSKTPYTPESLANRIYLRAGKADKRTAAHEVGHAGHGFNLLDLTPDDQGALFDALNRLSSLPGTHKTLEQASRSSIYNPKELFAAAVSLKATNDPGYKLFPPSVRKIVDKYIPAIVAPGGLGAFTLPDQADAAPMGKWKPQTLEEAAKLAKGYKPNHSTKRVIGRQVKLSILDRPSEQYTVANILRKGKTEDYMVVVQSASGERFQVPMTKDYIKVLAENTGADEYFADFATKDSLGQAKQAIKSLDIRKSKVKPYVPESLVADIQATAAYKAKDISPDLVKNYVWFKDNEGVTTYVPTIYAKLLAKLKRGTIIKDAARPATLGNPKVPFDFSIIPGGPRMGVTFKPDHNIPPINADSIEAYEQLLKAKALSNEEQAQALYVLLQSLNQKGRLP